MYNQVTLGADPEFFIFNEKTNKIQSAVGLIPGTKEEPYRLSEICSIQRDNVLLEINIIPTYRYDEFSGIIQNSIHQVNSFLKSKDKNLSLKIASHYNLDPEDLRDDEAFHFGCNRDYDVWGIDTIERINPYHVGTLRTCGGHIHLGIPNSNPDVIENIVKLLDLFIGIPSVLYDDDSIRKTLYGKAGRFRPTPYGLEYRTPSNFWTKNTRLSNWIAKTALNIGRHYNRYTGKLEAFLDEENIKLLKKIINNNDVLKAHQLIKTIGHTTIEYSYITQKTIEKLRISNKESRSTLFEWKPYYSNTISTSTSSTTDPSATTFATPDFIIDDEIL